MYKVKAKYLGVQLHSGRSVAVLSNDLSQEDLKALASSPASAAFIENVPARPEVKTEVKKSQKKEVKDEKTTESTEAPSGGEGELQ